MKLKIYFTFFQIILLIKLYSQNSIKSKLPLVFPYQVNYYERFGIVNELGEVIRKPDSTLSIYKSFEYPREPNAYLILEKYDNRCFMDRNGKWILNPTFRTSPMRKKDCFYVADSLNRLGIYNMYRRRWECLPSSNTDSVELLGKSIDINFLPPPEFPSDQLTFNFIKSSKELVITITSAISKEKKYRHNVPLFNEYGVVKPIFDNEKIIDYVIVLDDYSVLNSKLETIIPRNHKVSSLKVIGKFITFLTDEGNISKANLCDYKGILLATFNNVELEPVKGYEKENIFFKALAFGKEFFVRNDGVAFLPSDIKLKWNQK